MNRTCLKHIKRFFVFTILFVGISLVFAQMFQTKASANSEPVYNLDNISTFVNSEYNAYLEEKKEYHNQNHAGESLYPTSGSEETNVITTIEAANYYEKGTTLVSDDGLTSYVVPVIICQGYLFKKINYTSNFEDSTYYAVVEASEVTKELIEEKIVVIKETNADGTISYYRENTKMSNIEDTLTTKMLLHEDEGMVTWQVEVEQTGFYNLALTYYTIEGNRSNIERSLAINGEVPFSGADTFTFSRVWTDDQSSYKLDENGELILKTDVKGNDMKPKQVENPQLLTTYFVDDMGYETEPYMFYLEAGTNYISLISIKEPILISEIYLTEVKENISYEEYLRNLQSKYQTTISNQSVRLEAEKTSSKSSPTLYPTTDRSSSLTYPFSYSLTKLNSIGGTSWQVLGDWICWEFEVPESGFYNITMRAKQNMVRGMYSSRKVYINDELLFEELNDVQFPYANRWQLITLGNGEKDYLFYFEKGKTYTLKMEVTLGAYAPLIEEIQDCIDDLSALYRKIISYTTVTPDAGRDYELTKKFPTLIEDLTRNRDKLQSISDEISAISGGKSDKTGVIDNVVHQLSDFIKRHRTIPERLSTFSSNISSLGTLLNTLRELPLQLDYIQIHTPDVKLGRANENFFRRIGDSIVSFVLSFFLDYSSINAFEEDANLEDSKTVEVWMTLGRDQANVIRSLIDTDFKKKHPDIKVELKLTAADVLLKATLAGIGPDVALNVDSSLPVNYALRNAVCDLSEYIYEYEYEIEYDNNGFPKVSSTLKTDQYGNKTIQTGYVLATDMIGDLDGDGNLDEFVIKVQRFLNNQYPTFFSDEAKQMLGTEVCLTSGMIIPTYIYDLNPAYFNVCRAVDNSKIEGYLIKDRDFLLLEEGLDYDFYSSTSAYQTAQNVYMRSSLRQFQFAYEYDDNRMGYGTYALPEKQIFLMMFVRDDIMEELGLSDLIPETWDDMIDLISELQTSQLQFYLPVNDAGATALNPIFVSKLYQEGGQLYADDNKSTGLKSDAAMRAFEEWTEYYTLYSFPKSASFVNRFRSGEMPIGIAYYELYNTLSVFAPELKGKWSFHMIPGTQRTVNLVDEAGNITGETVTYVDHTATASGTGCVMMRQPSNLSEKEAKAQKDASWEFMKWWSSAETQTSFGREMEGILGSAARHTTANVKALQQLAWPKSDLNILMSQWSQVHEMPQIAGSYISGREIENAYRQVINNYYNPREVLYEYAEKINVEIDRKRTEFGLKLK